MNEHQGENGLERRDAEWRFLASLCASATPPMLRAEFCAKVHAGAFADFAHQVVFQEISAMSKPENARSARDLREHLPSRVTARGFPDLDFPDLVSDEGFSQSDAQTRLQQAYERLISNQG